MSRTSRIQHPPGSRFVLIYHWAVAQWGLAEAAVLGLLDFLDRGQQTEGRPLASRQRIVADLEGIVGRDLVDRALRTLVNAGALKEHKQTTVGERNLQTRIDYCLNVEGITRILDSAGTPDFRSSGTSGNQDGRGLLKAGLKSGVPSNKEEVEVTTTTTTVVDDLEELIEAGVWAAGLTSSIRNEAGLRRKIRSRLLAEGPNQEDRHAHLAWRSHQAQAAAVKAAQVNAREALLSVPPTPIDPDALARGLQLLPASLRRRISMKAEQ